GKNLRRRAGAARHPPRRRTTRWHRCWLGGVSNRQRNAKKSVFPCSRGRETRGACIVAVMNPADAPGESKPTLLIVDDDQELCAMLAEYLAPEGFLALTAGTGPAGLEQLGRAAVDLVVLDVMLPELSGFEVLRRIRAVSRVPVIMLTARGEEVDRVVGLEMGADDYLAKPFSPRELVARIRAVRSEERRVGKECRARGRGEHGSSK